jgi:hypothetical protein
MSDESRIMAAILLIAVPTVEIGGLSLLGMLTRRAAGWDDNPMRRGMFRAGHAHAGVWIILALVALIYIDATDLSGGWRWLVRLCFGAAPILMPLGFFLSVVDPRAERPNRLILLVYLGGAALAVGALILGIGLLAA